MNQPPEHVDLIIRGGILLTMNPDMWIGNEQNIVVNNAKIVAILNDDECRIRYVASQTIEAQDCIVMPGLINAHTHVPMTYLRGLADDLPLQKWLHEFIWPIEGKLLSPDFVYHASLHGAAEMIKNGITLASDMYFYGDDIARALTTAGMRGILGEAIIDMKITDKAAIGSFAVTQNIKYKDNPLIAFSIAPHSIYACCTETLNKCAEVAIEHNLLLHTHLSETPSEVENCLSEHLLRPVEYLNTLDFLNAKTVFAHGIWVNESEMDLLRENNASIAICTESNLKLSAGIAPLKQYIAKGVNYCLATDGVASNNNLDLLGEMDITAKIQKTHNDDPTFLPAADLVKAVTINAARAIHREHDLGSIEIGKLADLIVIPVNELQHQPMYNPYSHLVYAINGHSVRDVVIHGKVVMQDKKLSYLDENELLARAKTYQTTIKKELSL